jgi:hypothetical protein
VLGGRFAEGYAVANDLEQAQGKVFQAARRICEASPYLRREATITPRVSGNGRHDHRDRFRLCRCRWYKFGDQQF